MSFDLYFCWHKRERINFGDVKAWAVGIESFSAKGDQLWYASPTTGVYFSFDFEAKAPESPEDGPDIPDGHFDSGLSFNLNYNRPSYFGFEAMPIVESLASRFSLDIVNPQGNFAGPESVTVADSNALTRSWIHHNRQAVLVMMEQPNSARPLSMAAASSTYLWRYVKGKEDLQRSCGEAVFVPSLVPVQRKGDTRALRATIYTQGLPTIVPECEWVFIVRRRKGLFRSKKEQEVAAISVETFRELLAGYMKPFAWQGLQVQIISPEVAENAGKIIGAIERTVSRAEFEIIGMDSFVDIDLPTVHS